ncbi:MAG: hypothetical protein MJ057_05345 [Sphaerochaetaceae bacterium]|nr:hypothetical protein [Sphaerochaetaceae bacterium]
MEDENSSIRIIDEHLNRYLALARDINCDRDTADRAFSTLKDLLVVEIYFMKHVRAIISDDEMSGFILYMDKRLRPIINKFDSTKASFGTYIRRAVESKAATYMMELRRKTQFDACYTTHYLPYEGTTVAEEPSPEDYLMLKDDFSYSLEELCPTDKLRYVCSVRPARQRYTFIFLCTMLPYLSTETIDAICTLLNFDISQTHMIADYLFGITEANQQKRNNRRYMEIRYNHFWIRSVELENAIRMGGSSASLQQMLSYNRAMMQKTRELAATMKKRVSYPQLGKTLHLKESTIATAVYETRKLLQLALDSDSVNDECLGKLFESMDNSIKTVKAYPFEPFKEFGIDQEIVKAPRLNTCFK